MYSDDKDYNLFLQSIPYMFDSEPCKFLISHYLWSSEDKRDQLIIHLRLYDLIRRIYYVKLKKEPDHDTVLRAMTKIFKNTWMKNHILHYITNGIFPSGKQLKLLKM